MYHVVDIDGPRQKVTEAIATEEGLRSFWVPTAETKPEVGHEARFLFDGASGPLKMRVDQLEDGKLVKWTCTGDFPNWTDTTVTWEVEDGPTEGTSRVIFAHANWSEGTTNADLGGFNYVWGQVLGRLKAYVETGQPQPFFPKVEEGKLTTASGATPKN